METESRKIINIPVEVENPENPKDGDIVYLTIDGKIVKCVFRDYTLLDFNPKTNPEVRHIIKIQPSMVIEAEGGEEVTTTQDGISTSRIAEKGQYIIQNFLVDGTTEESYIFGNAKVSVAAQAEKFLSTYEELDAEKSEQLRQKFIEVAKDPEEIKKAKKARFYQKKPIPLPVIEVKVATAIQPSWSKGFMGTPAGGLIAQGEYTISKQSRADYYREVEVDKSIDQV